jgi:hypothetical protein
MNVVSDCWIADYLPSTLMKTGILMQDKVKEFIFDDGSA